MTVDYFIKENGIYLYLVKKGRCNVHRTKTLFKIVVINTKRNTIPNTVII